MEKLDEWILFDARRPNVEVDRAGVKQVLDMIIDSNNEQEARIKELEKRVEKIVGLMPFTKLPEDDIDLLDLVHDIKDKTGMGVKVELVPDKDQPECNHEPVKVELEEAIKYLKEQKIDESNLNIWIDEDVLEKLQNDEDFKKEPQFKVGDVVKARYGHIGRITSIDPIFVHIDYGYYYDSLMREEPMYLATEKQRKEFIKKYGDRSKGER